MIPFPIFILKGVDFVENRAVLEGIRARRSVRRYADRPVEQEKVDLLLECACAAPSAANRRPWRFVVIRDRGNLDALAEVHPYGKMLFQAPLALVVCGTVLHEGRENPWWEEDCAAAMQNILLAAEGLGLSSVWLGVRWGRDGLPEKIEALLGTPRDVRVMGIAVVGYGDESKPPHRGIDEGVVHLERWTDRTDR